MTHRLQRIFLLTLFLPQLLVLGMGRSLVICVTSDGHMQVELVSSSCCQSPPAAVPGEDAVEQNDETDEFEECGSCTDLAIVTDLIGPKRTAEFQLDAQALLPLDSLQTALLFEPRPELGKFQRTLESASPHLSHLRCVRLRC